MDRQDNITLLGITNFLQEGALLRHQDQWILVEGPFTEKTFHDQASWSVYVTDFYDFNSEKEWVGTKTHVLRTDEFQKILERAQEEAQFAEPPKQFLWQEPSKNDFSKTLQQIQSLIQIGDIQKAVPVVFSEVFQTVSIQDQLLMIQNLLQAPANLFVYGFWKSGHGVLGATPELLFEFQNSELKTMALAGTCPKEDSNTRTYLLEDAKEMQEHRLVVEDIKNQLQGLGTLKLQGPGVMELPTLFHLRTDFYLHSEKKFDYMSLIRLLHPTPALGVAPRSYGFQWMKSFLGQGARHWYGAPICFSGPDEAICLVGIRNIQWDAKSARIGSGCGIVADSTLDQEWRELAKKRQSVQKILGL